MINRAYEVHGKVARFYMLQTRASRGRRLNYHFHARHPRVVRARLEMGGGVHRLARESSPITYSKARKVYFINNNLFANALSANPYVLRFNVRASYISKYSNQGRAILFVHRANSVVTREPEADQVD